MAGLFDRLQDEIDSREQQEGLSPVDLLDLPPALATVIQQIVRRNGMKLTEIATVLNQSPDEAQRQLDDLVAKGYLRRVEVKDQIWYKAHFRHKGQTISDSFWTALTHLIDEEE